MLQDADAVQLLLRPLVRKEIPHQAVGQVPFLFLQHVIGAAVEGHSGGDKARQNLERNTGGVIRIGAGAAVQAQDMGARAVAQGEHVLRIETVRSALASSQENTALVSSSGAGNLCFGASR